MIDENLARLRAHHNNISRYRRLLKTQLTDCERQFIERRLFEEQSAMETVAATPFPPAFRKPASGSRATPIAEAVT